MRYTTFLFFLVGCSTVPVVPMGDAGPGLEGDAGPVLVDSGVLPEVDAGTDAEPSDAGVDATVPPTDAGPSALDRSETTWAYWRFWTPDTDAGMPGSGPGCTFGLGDSYPVNCVSQDLAAAYCEARGLRLPTRAEWLAETEHAALDDREVAGVAAPLPAAQFCTVALCGPRGNVREWTSEPGVAMGGAYDDAAPNLDTYTGQTSSPRIGFRCRTR